jgi:hypothetical protein
MDDGIDHERSRGIRLHLRSKANHHRAIQGANAMGCRENPVSPNEDTRTNKFRSRSGRINRGPEMLDEDRAWVTSDVCRISQKEIT